MNNSYNLSYFEHAVLQIVTYNLNCNIVNNIQYNYKHYANIKV